MPVRFTKAADADLEDIYLHGLLQFGLQQAEAYRQRMEATFHLIERNPGMGRALSEGPEATRAHVFRAHVILYRRTGPSEVLILRIRSTRENWFTGTS